MKKRLPLVALLSFLAIYGIAAAVQVVRIDKYVGELASLDAAQRQTAEECLAREGSAAVSSLVAGMPSRNAAVTVAHLRALSRIFLHDLSLSSTMNCYTGYVPGQAAAIKSLHQMLPLFVTSLNSRSAEIRLAALEAVFGNEDGWHLVKLHRFNELPSLVDAVNELVEDDDRQVRVAAFRVAAALPRYDEEPRVLEALMRAAREESFPTVQRAAVEAVVVRLAQEEPRDQSYKATIELSEAITRLVDERLGNESSPIDYKDEEFCLRCIMALDKLGAADGVGRFVSSSNPRVARQAASVLRQRQMEQR